MTERRNLVPFPPSGLVIALQYWSGDEADAMRLARLMADIEPRRRDDVMLMFCRRFDTPVSAEFWRTFLHCGTKFPVGQVTSRREGVGHPAGSNGLWSGTMDQLAASWRAGNLHAASAFLCEADGCPLTEDWIDRLKAEHEATLVAGKRVTGPVMARAVPHINGNQVAHLSLWFDRPSLHETPAAQAWDLFHAAVLMAEARPTIAIVNAYGSREWSDAALASLRGMSCYLANVKDPTAIAWAERTLVAARAPELGTEEPTPASGPRRVTVRG